MERLLSFLVLVGVAQLGFSCTCYPTHPQEHYCTSDTVFLATAGNRTEHPKEYSASYDLLVHKIFKEPSDPQAFFSERTDDGSNETRVTLTTANNGAACGVALTPGDRYILGGKVTSGRMETNICGLLVDYNSLTRKQLQGFSRKFGLNCDCKAVYCMGRGCDTGAQSPDECVQSFYDVVSGCLDRYARCRRDQATGRCEWTAKRVCRARRLRKLV